MASNNIRTIPILLKLTITEFHTISSLLNIYFKSCTFDNFLQDVSPARLFCTVRLLILRNSPTCMFIWACTSIRYTRVQAKSMWNVQFKIIKQVKTLGYWWNWAKSFTIKYHWIDWYWTWCINKWSPVANKSPVTLFNQDQWKSSFTNWWIKVGYASVVILL